MTETGLNKGVPSTPTLADAIEVKQSKNVITNLWNAISNARAKLNLPCPGSFENLHRESKG